MSDILFKPATQLIHAIADRQISSVELLALMKQQYEKVNPDINAIVAVDFERAENQAREADNQLSRGLSFGPLHGLPMTIKDSIEVEGLPCVAGAPELSQHFSTTSATVVNRLKNAGAIIFGKTNVPYLTQGFQTYNEVYGQTNNPWNTNLVPGGSSGGAVAALASGQTSLEAGSDVGGSVRIPAHFCGVYGHKPSFGIVPLRGHIPPLPGMLPTNFAPKGDIAVIGPLARSAEDLDLLLNVISGPAEHRKIAWKLELPAPRKCDIRDFRVGCWLDDPYCPVSTEIADHLQSVIDELIRAGVQILDQRPPIDFSRCNNTYRKLKAANFSPGLSSEVFETYREEANVLDKDDKSSRAHRFRGATMLHRDWMMLDFHRLLMQQQWHEFFKEYDVLLCPAAPVTAFPHDHRPFDDVRIQVDNEWRPYDELLVSWAGLASVAYLPSTVAPTGLSTDGMPVGIQIIGPHLEDRTTIQFASQLNQIIDGFIPPPSVQ